MSDSKQQNVRLYDVDGQTIRVFGDPQADPNVRMERQTASGGWERYVDWPTLIMEGHRLADERG